MKAKILLTIALIGLLSCDNNQKQLAKAERLKELNEERKAQEEKNLREHDCYILVSVEKAEQLQKQLIKISPKDIGKTYSGAKVRLDNKPDICKEFDKDILDEKTYYQGLKIIEVRKSPYMIVFEEKNEGWNSFYRIVIWVDDKSQDYMIPVCRHQDHRSPWIYLFLGDGHTYRTLTDTSTMLEAMCNKDLSKIEWNDERDITIAKKKGWYDSL